MGVKVNLSGVEVRRFEPLPQGRYRAEVASMEHIPASKRSGKPKVRFVFNVLKGLEASNEDFNVEGRKAFYEVSLQEQSLWNLKRTLIALGDDPEELEGEVELDPEDYVGREVVIVIGHDYSYDGTCRDRVRRLEAIG